MRVAKLSIIIIVSLVLLGALSCRRPYAKKNEMVALDIEAREAVSLQEWEKVDSLGNLMLTKARHNKSRYCEANALTFLSYYDYPISDSVAEVRMNHLSRALDIAREIGNDTLLCRVYNQMGVWELVHNKAYYTAQYYFNKAIELATRSNNRELAVRAESNMSEVCRMIGDTLGHVYDRDIYNYAKNVGDPMLTFSSAFHCASYLARTSGDSAMIARYVADMRKVNAMEGLDNLVLGEYYFHKGDMKRALEFVEKAHPEEYIDSEILQARIMAKLGNAAESNRILNDVFASFQDLNTSDQSDAISIYADNLSILGDKDGAYQWMKRYKAFRDSVDAEIKVDLIHRYRTEYEVNAKDRQIAEEKRRADIMSIILSLGGIIIVLTSGGIWIYIRRRNKLYQDIVRQNMDSLAREKELENLLSAEKDKAMSVAKGGTDSVERRQVTSGKSQIPQEKVDAIFNKICEAMDVDRVWRDKSMSQVAFAEKVGCNRAYLSEVIKLKTGMSYTQFINARRVREAVKMLSDPTCSIPVKDMNEMLGFLSVSSFYSAFKQETGMSPAIYRQMANKLK